jgi:hypothetical protein
LGVSFAFSIIEEQAMSGEALECELALMMVCWEFFDNVHSCVSAEMKRGPLNGGRDQDHMGRHTFAAELDWAKKVGVLTPLEVMLTDEGGLPRIASSIATQFGRCVPKAKWPALSRSDT